MKGLRVLVVEDDAIIGFLLGEMLSGMGHDVCAIEVTEADAVAAAVRCKPELMIVDARLRQGNGVSAVEEILRAGPVPYFFISGARVQAARPDAVVLRKPFLEFELVGTIKKVLADAAAVSGPAVSQVV